MCHRAIYMVTSSGGGGGWFILLLFCSRGNWCFLKNWREGQHSYHSLPTTFALWVSFVSSVLVENCCSLSTHMATRSDPCVYVPLRWRGNRSLPSSDQLLWFPFPLWIGSFVLTSLNHPFWLVNRSHNEEIHMAWNGMWMCMCVN